MNTVNARKWNVIRVSEFIFSFLTLMEGIFGWKTKMQYKPWMEMDVTIRKIWGDRFITC
jgi:hypothetical protein